MKTFDVEYENASLKCDNCGKVFERLIAKNYIGLILCSKCIKNTPITLKLFLAANKLVKSILLTGLFLLPFLILYIADWSFIKGSITEYPVFCPPNYVEGNGCYTLRTTTYYPNSRRQEVIMKSDFEIKTLSKCTVLNRRNWECRWDDESGTFGFNDGEFHSTALKLSPGRTWKEELEWSLQERYVPRYLYLLEWWNII